MEADHPVVLLAYAHSSKKKRGIQDLRSLESSLQGSFQSTQLNFLREGHQGSPWGSDVFESRSLDHQLLGIHLVVETDESNSWWLNDYAGRKKKLDWDTASLDKHQDLSWVWIQGNDSPEPAEQLLFAGAPVVLLGPEALAHQWLEYLRIGYSIRDAWELLDGDLPVHTIPSDPFEYWEWRENRNHDHLGPSLMVLSTNTEALYLVPFEGLEDIEEPEPEPIEIEQEFYSEPEPQAEPQEEIPEVIPEVIPEIVHEVEAEVIPKIEKEKTKDAVDSAEFYQLPRTVNTARREELEYRHPGFEESEPELGLALLDESWENFEVSEERIIEIIHKQDIRFAPRRRILATAISSCLGVALLMVGVWQMGWKLSNEQMDRLSYFTTFTDSSQFRVLLLPFHREDGCEPTEIWDEMAVRDHLLSRPEAQELGLEVTYITPGSCPEITEDARRLAEIYNADLLVWGDPTGDPSSPQLQLHYVLSPGASDIPMEHLLQLHHLSDGFLGGNSETVVNQILALGFSVHQQPREALGYLDQETEVPSQVAAWQELAVVLSLEELHLPEEALSRCESALDTFGNHESLSFHAERLRTKLFPSNSGETDTPAVIIIPFSDGLAVR